MLLPTAPSPSPQEPFDAAVVIPTMLRASLVKAVRSVFAQDLAGRVQILIGIDVAEGDLGIIERLREECPARMHLTVLHPGYSTSVRHGGLHANRFSGALRTILSYLANSRFVAYLDDDNWWAPEHLSSLKTAIVGTDWAFSRRWFVDPVAETPLCIDDWESVGPGAGVYVQQFGGFVDPSSLMIDKLACIDVLPLWAMSPFADGSGEDRLVFEGLRTRHRSADTGQATSFYRMQTGDNMHLERLQKMRERGVVMPSDRAAGIRPLAALTASFPAMAVAAGSVEASDDLLLRDVVARLKPREMVVLGDVRVAVTLTTLALAQELSPLTLIAANPAPTIPAPLAPHLALLPEAKDGPFASLIGAGIAVDLTYVGVAGSSVSAALEAAWGVTRVGGIILVEAHEGTTSALRATAGRIGATLHDATIGDRARWLIQKDH